MNSNAKPGMLRVGTSNITLPGSKKDFPTAFRDKSRLTYYASLFNTLEVNSSFYKLPQATTWQRWANEVPADFTFSVKLSKRITHEKQLKFSVADVDLFMETVVLPPAQRGCLLIQFPGQLSVEYFSPVKKLLAQVRKHLKKNPWQMAVEFRHTSWYQQRTVDLLNDFGTAMVLHDMPKSRNTKIFANAPVVYFRFHGMQGDYRGSYDTDYLDKIIAQSRDWIAEGKDVYLYFNNTIGDAFNNARYINLQWKLENA